MQRFRTWSLNAFLHWQRRWDKYKNHPLTWLGIFAIVAVVVGFVLAEPAWAQSTTVAPSRLEQFFSWVAGGLVGIAGFLGDIFLLLIQAAISVMQYNGFSNSAVVTTGWVIVRDVMNIFFVMILIVIAMGTMFGATNKFKWYQQVPRLLLFALLINFSRTICVIMIDFGQVVMLTFANAMKDIMAGNFISVFGIADLMRFSQSVDTGYTGYGYFAAAFMTVAVLVAVIITMGILVMILVYRIVLLWVLIVLSPLAFFLGGAKDLFGEEGYAKWWSQFKCAVIIGPVLTFFLWLTLSVAGAGGIAITEGFTTASTSTQNLTGSLLKVFEKGNFLSLLISIGMLYAGFDAAMSFCTSESIISGAIGRAKKYVGTAAKFTAGGAAALALFGTKKGAGAAVGVGREVSRGASDVARRIPLARGLTAAGQANLLRRGSTVAAAAGLGTAARVLGGAAESREAKVAGDYMQAGKKVEGMSRRTMVDTLSATAVGGAALLPSQRREQAVMFAKAMSDPKARKELEESGHMEKLYKEFSPDLEKLKSDEKMAESIGKFEESRPDLTGKVDKIRDISDVRKLDQAALMDSEVQDRLKSMTDVPDSFANKFEKENPGKTASIYEYMAAGRMGSAMKSALTQGRAGVLEQKSPEELAAMPPENIVGDLNMEMVNKSPEMVVNVMNSSHPSVQNGLQQMDPAVYGRMLEASAGITPTGEIKDAAKLSDFATGNAAAIGNIDTTAMSPAVASVVAGSIKAKDFQQMAGRIQRNPEANENLKENFKKLSEEVAKGDYDDQTVRAATNFDRQMRALEARQRTTGQTSSVAEEPENEATVPEPVDLPPLE